MGQIKILKPLEFNETGGIGNITDKHGMIKGMFSKDVLQGPQSLGIRDYLDKTETKKKD